MQVNQLPTACITKPSGTIDAGRETCDASAKNEFMKLVEQLLGGSACGSACENTMLFSDGTIPFSNTCISMALTNDNKSKQKGMSKTNDKQFQALSPQLIQEIASMQTLALQATTNILLPIMVNQNPAEGLSGVASTEQVTASSSLENAMMLDAKNLKVSNLFKQAEQQAATLPIITIPLQLTAQTMQDTDILCNNRQTDTKQDTSTDFMKTNVKETGALDTGQAEHNVLSKGLKTNSQAISTPELQNTLNEFSDANDLQRLFAELNIINIQSNVFNGQTTDKQQGDIPQKRPVFTAQPIMTVSTQASQALLSIKMLGEKAPVEVNTALQTSQENMQGVNQHIDATGILNLLNSTNLQAEQTLEKQTNAVQTNAVQTNAKNISKLIYNPNWAVQTDIAEQASSMVGSFTPFQSNILDKNAVVKPKNEKTHYELKLTQDEAFKQVLTATDKNQVDTAKSNYRDISLDKQDKTANDMSGNGLGNVQTFSVNAIEDPNHSKAQSIVRQTSNAIAQAVSTNRSDFKVHLNPEDLGGITIKMVSKNGTISIRIIADNPHTGQLLSGSIGDLNTAIGQHGITVGKSEILHTGTNISFSAGDFSGHRQQAGQQKSQQQTQQYKQSENALLWSPVMHDEKQHANRVMPQTSSRGYDIMA